MFRFASRVLSLLSAIAASLREAVALLTEIRDELKPPEVGAQLEVTLPDGTVLKGEHVMATITDIQSVPLTFVEVDAKGNPTGVTPGPVTFVSSDPTIVSVTQATPGAADAVAAAVGPLGSAVITATGDGFSATDTVTVTPSAATAAQIVEGTPTP